MSSFSFGGKSSLRVELCQRASLDEEQICVLMPSISATAWHLGTLLNFSESQFLLHAQRFSDSDSDKSVKANIFFIFKKLIETAEASLRVEIHAQMDL